MRLLRDLSVGGTVFGTSLAFLQLRMGYLISLKRQFTFRTSQVHFIQNFARNSMVQVFFPKNVRFTNGGHFKIRPHYFFQQHSIYFQQHLILFLQHSIFFFCSTLFIFCSTLFFSCSILFFSSSILFFSCSILFFSCSTLFFSCSNIVKV